MARKKGWGGPPLGFGQLMPLLRVHGLQDWGLVKGALVPLLKRHLELVGRLSMGEFDERPIPVRQRKLWPKKG